MIEIIKKTWEIGNELEKELVDSILNVPDSWTNLMNGCLKKVNEPVPVIPRVKTKRKKLKKLFNRSNTILSNISSRSSKSKRKSNY